MLVAASDWPLFTGRLLLDAACGWPPAVGSRLCSLASAACLRFLACLASRGNSRSLGGTAGHAGGWLLMSSHRTAWLVERCVAQQELGFGAHAYSWRCAGGPSRAGGLCPQRRGGGEWPVTSLGRVAGACRSAGTRHDPLHRITLSIHRLRRSLACALAHARAARRRRSARAEPCWSRDFATMLMPCAEVGTARAEAGCGVVLP